MCINKCGVASEDKHLVCMKNSAERSVRCDCKDEKKEFDKSEKKCKDDRCLDVCGVSHRENQYLDCEGDYFTEDLKCICTDEKKIFDYTQKKCRADRCLDICGVRYYEDDEIQCKGDYFEEDLKCVCQDEKKGFDTVGKKCKVDRCLKTCGIRHDGSHRGTNVKCEGDPFGLHVTCLCDHEEQAFDPDDKKCKDDRCIDLCGVPHQGSADIACEGNYFTEYVKCICKDEKKLYDPTDKKCKADRCLDICGVHSYESGDVECLGNHFTQNVKCNCKNERKAFEPVSKKCKVDWCLEMCGVRHGEDWVIKCESGPFEKDAKCICADEKNTFDRKDKTCRADRCLEKCGVRHDDSGSDVECVGYPFGEGDVVCKCSDGKLFDSANKECRETCRSDEECFSGGVCEERDDGVKFCACPEGTEGSFCETVIACKYRDCGSDAKCVVEAERGVCKCKNADLSFDYKDKKCKEMCGARKKCLNGGICETGEDGGKFCACPEGTEGLYCETVSACTDMVCGTEARCEWDSGKKIAICRCNEETLSFDAKDKKCKVNKCKVACGVDLEVKGGIACVGDPYGSADVSCQCKEKGKEFLVVSKSCKEVKGLSNLLIGGIVTATFCTFLTAGTILYHTMKKRKWAREATTHYRTRSHDQSIRLESALYDASKGTLVFGENKRL